ncbi:phosphatase PAP2 family protein [Chlorogloeopsis sp. ULAP01]|uniref:phosphatase PAP2 family protein n=1 Tax=Chlorogloeopsis sp. ULAP01 TaxID=3056483 RepID=UPI0025AB3B86|nr:phosphatase PAP2 family protein [Chlorogloeopsis sp. ULAP01]MDM9383869.1 phosphatase PAP2 family protein [Chlorogloeopsis sp. ULAP01]
MEIDKLWSPEPIIYIQKFFGDSWDLFFQIVTELGAVAGVAVVFALVFWISGRRLAWCLVGAVVLVTAINMIIWSIFDVPRPNHPEINVYRELDTSSFPSGHTGTATIFWTTLTTLSRIPLAVTVCVIFLVMMSRLYLGVHYVGDVIGGLIIGLILFKIYLKLWPIVLQWFRGRTFKLFSVLSLSTPIAVFPFADSFPEGWEVFGAAVGAGIAVPLELWYVRYSPAKVSVRKILLKVVIGLGVLGTIVFASSFINDNESVRDVINFGLGTFWILFLAPALFARMRL